MNTNRINHNNERFDITKNILILACDVSKDKINLYTETPGGKYERVSDNRTDAVEKELRQFDLFISAGKYAAAAVVSEPTGIYHDTLFRIARRLGMYTAYVSDEAVSKMRVIESSDTGKTDIKDPRVIYTLARIGKTLRHRIFEEPFSLLRQWNHIYDTADQGVVQAKCAVHSLIRHMFPDFGMKKDFIFGKSGRALMQLYGFSPNRIVSAGEAEFTRKMKALSPRTQNESLTKIYRQAENTLKRGVNERHLNLLSIDLSQRWEDLNRNSERKAEAKEEMETLYNEARRIDPNLPAARKGVISLFHLSRIIAETGPLSDFGNSRKLMRFAGLNLRERQSGLYRGKTRISKKGRPLLRKVLKLAVLPPVRQNGIYGDYYKKKKEADKMPGTKAMTVIARHFPKMLYGVYKNGSAFDKERMFVCESQFKDAA
jgi:transposase